MTAVLKPSDPRPPSAPKRLVMPPTRSRVAPFAPPVRTRYERQPLAQPQPFPLPSAPAPVVRSLPRPRPIPAWLRLLVGLHRGSVVATFLLVTAVLSVYGWTVHTQQLWGKAYNHLERLKTQERQLTLNNELLKDKIAQQAEDKTSGLQPASTHNIIFVPPTPPRPAPVVAQPSLVPDPTGPVGY